MKKVLILCGTGVGTSVMMKLKVKNFAKENKLDLVIDSDGLSEGKSSIPHYDAVICSTQLVEELGKVPEQTTVIAVKNMLNVQSYGEELKKLVQKD